MKRRERNWMYDRLNGRNLKLGFLKGVEDFLEYCRQNPESSNVDEVRCPCSKCKNLRLYDAKTVKDHLHKKGFIPDYYDWYCHGESFSDLDQGNSSSQKLVGNSSSQKLVGNSSFQKLVGNSSQKLVGNSSSPKLVGNLSSQKLVVNSSSQKQVGNSSSQKLVVNVNKNNQELLATGNSSAVEEEPNVEAKQFFDLLKAAEQPLYDGSTMSVLEMASKITSLKCVYNLQHKCVDGFASLLSEAIPDSNNIGRTFLETKKVIKGLELPHEKIHACPKGCMLFWRGDAHLDKCRLCDSDRYKKTSKGALVPSKVLIYFPITPRLQRLFATKSISKDMTWHAKKPRVQNQMVHPRDSEAWKHLDRSFPDFASEPRNVRLGMCTNGFAPHDKFGGQYVPVTLTPYNLPPSLCMKKPFMFLSLLVPGSKKLKRNLDVYMQPLVEELKQLWENGATTYDISRKQNFNLRAAILWTISDFPAYGILSGWSTSGKKACPYCLDKCKAFWLDYGGKVSWFDCHRQFLSPDHPFRNNKIAFCKNRVEKNSPPYIMSGEELWRCVKDMPKAIDGPEALKRIKKAKKGWFKQSILWELPYWKNLLIRHNLDVMHIEKNFFNQFINTVMDVKKHTSDTVAARKDMARVCKRTQLELTVDDRGKESMPKAPFTLDKAQKKVLCEWVRDLRFPDGYASNLTRFVDLQTCKLRGMKSHDCHVFMERLLPVALKELLPEHVWKPITEISQFFRDLCSSTIKMSDMERLEHNIAEILCKLEVIFPPAFFDSMEHLPLHLPYEAKVGGPVQYRWMYPFERFLHHLKRKVGNKSRIKSSICNAYLNEEIANFCSHYFQSEVDTKALDLGKNVNSKVERHLQEKDVPELFKAVCGRAPNEGSRRFLEDVEYQHAHMFVLANCGILGDYEKRFEEHIVRTRPGVVLEDVWEKCEAEFSEWFKSQVLRSMTTSDVMRALAMGPCKQAQTWSQFSVNGFSFQTYEYGKHKSTMNYGVCVSHQDGSEFGILDDVIELVYTGNLGVYKTILFKCSWMEDINIHEQYKLVEVNHVKKNPNCNPFVLPYQVRQVYFAPYPSLKKDCAQWWAVFKTKAKSVIDGQVDSDIFQEATIEVPPALCAPDEIPEYNDEEGISQDEDDGVEGMLVDAEEEADDDESSCDSSDDSGAADDDDEDDDSDLFC